MRMSSERGMGGWLWLHGGSDAEVADWLHGAYIEEHIPEYLRRGGARRECRDGVDHWGTGICIS